MVSSVAGGAVRAMVRASSPWREATTITSATRIATMLWRSRPLVRSPSTTDDRISSRTSPETKMPWAAAIGRAR